MSNPDLRTLRLTVPVLRSSELTPGREHIHAGLVGEAIDCAPMGPVGTFTGAVVSSPAGSSAAWAGTSFTPDVAGEYVLSGANGTLPPLSFRLRVFPASALNANVIANPFAGNHPSSPYSGPLRTEIERRAILRGIARESYGNVSAAAFAALTTNAPIPSGLALPRGTTGGVAA